MYCRKCGKMVHDQAKTCVHCGEVFVHQIPTASSSQYTENSAYWQDLKSATERKYQSPTRNQMKYDDNVSAGLCILSFIFPLFGWVYWGIKKSETPNRALACGMMGICSFVYNLIVSWPMLWH